MEINFLINHWDAELTANKALAKGLNPNGSMISTIHDARRLPIAGRENYWFSMIVDPADGCVLYVNWIKDTEAIQRFIEHPESTIEL